MCALIITGDWYCPFQASAYSKAQLDHSYYLKDHIAQLWYLYHEAPLLFVDAVIQCKSRCSK